VARPTPIINVMVQAARQAAKALVRDFGEVEQLQVSMKGPADFVSVADMRAERTLRQMLGKARPGFGFLMEESGETPGTDGRNRWIVDPLDGTTNFLHGIPHFAISIALETEGEVVAGIIHQPLTDETYWAEKGAGAYVNDRRLRVSGRRRLHEALFGTGIPFKGKGEHATYLATLGRIMAEVSGVRRNGAAALDLAYVAAGRFDGFWEFGLLPWDLAAGVLMIREAGGFVTDLAGGDDVLAASSVVAANAHFHPALIAMIRDAVPETGQAG